MVMPKDLYDLAQQHDCSQVSDFYTHRLGPVNPPYVYGYVPGEENSAVFWCERSEGDRKRYFLVIIFRKMEHELTKCPDIIEWLNPPGGLSIYRNPKVTLEEFYYLSNPKRKAPKNIRMSDNAILSENDGVSELFYCYKGEWLIRQSD
jgi:hypothetical protein